MSWSCAVLWLVGSAVECLVRTGDSVNLLLLSPLSVSSPTRWSASSIRLGVRSRSLVAAGAIVQSRTGREPRLVRTASWSPWNHSAQVPSRPNVGDQSVRSGPTVRAPDAAGVLGWQC